MREQSPCQNKKETMKIPATLAVMAITALFIPFTVAASGGGLVLNVSGTIDSLDTNNTDIKGHFNSMSVNEKDVYTLISNGVANAYGFLSTNLDATNLPANGYIAYNTAGIFYVTNKTGFYLPLSGHDKEANFYSFIELDTYVIYGTNILDFSDGAALGFGYFNCDVNSYHLNNKTGDGSGVDKSTATLFIHDNPYVYDDWDDPDRFFGYNDHIDKNAIEIRGVVTVQLKYADTNDVTMSSFSLTGAGNCLLNGAAFASLVSSGKAILSP
jgi:hypothetical protein